MNTVTNPSLFQKFIRKGLRLTRGLIAFILVFLISVELLLRLISYYKQETTNIDSAKYSILALGESTTARIDEQVDWPKQLETLLKLKNINASVYNEGKSATTTNAIVSIAPLLIEKYEPQLTITMMGINDYYLIWPKNFVLTDTKNDPLSFLKSYKFLKYLIATIKLKYANQTEPTRAESSILDHKNVKKLVQDLTEAPRSSPEYSRTVEELENFLKPKTYLEKAQFYKFLVEQLPYSTLSKHTDLNKSLDFIMRALRSGPGPSDNTATLALHLAISADQRSLCKEIIEYAKRDNVVMGDTFLLRAATCLEKDPEDPVYPEYSEYVEKLFEYAGGLYEFRGKSVEAPVRTNYLRMANLIEGTGVCWIAMGYPRSPASDGMLAVNKLGNKNIFMLLNQSNFEAALEKHTFEEVFTDNFATNFGHATTLGNGLIAANVYDFILKLKENRQCGF